ncbi:hypothetical protein ZWY2020_059479 [Hordeum vulgare]|nr:hypothetical protein ZWY2020_059479 [Hordeum vulgare]
MRRLTVPCTSSLCLCARRPVRPLRRCQTFLRLERIAPEPHRTTLLQGNLLQVNPPLATPVIHILDDDDGKIFEEETIVEGETIRSSRWPCTSSYVNPVNFLPDKNSHERRDSPSSAADSSAKNDSPLW